MEALHPEEVVRPSRSSLVYGSAFPILSEALMQLSDMPTDMSHGSQRHVRWLRIRHFKANLESFNLHGHLWLTNRELFLDEKLTLWWGWSGIQHWTSRMLKCHRFYPLVRYTWGLRPWRGGFPVVRKKKKEPVLFRSL